MRDRILAGLCALLLGAPGAVRAQQAEAWHDSSVSALHALRALRDSLLQGDSTTSEVARRGSLVIASSPSESQAARHALARFDSVRTWRFGSALPSAAGFRIVDRTMGAGIPVAPITATANVGNPGVAGTVVITAAPDTAGAPQVQFSGRSAELADDLLNRYGEMMIASVPALAVWIGTPPALSMNEQARRDEAMYALVTTNGDAARRCVAGDISACDAALQLSADTARGERLFTSFLRSDLLYFALDAGGDGAWDRMRAAGGAGVPAMLAAGARMPADSAVARWRRNLLQRRPDVAIISPATAILALGWSALLLLGALGASKWA